MRCAGAAIYDAICAAAEGQFGRVVEYWNGSDPLVAMDP
jgi:hypothetical protein